MIIKINEKSTLNVKLTVEPILFTMYHIHAYMGPCRYGEGYALTAESDMEVAQSVPDKPDCICKTVFFYLHMVSIQQYFTVRTVHHDHISHCFFRSIHKG